MTVEVDTVAMPQWRINLKTFIEHTRTRQVILALIIFNAAILGLETSATARHMTGNLLPVLDSIIIAIFVAELAIKGVVYGRGFVRDPWNLFDLFVVAGALVPASNASILRALRVLRVLRVIPGMAPMRRVVGALLSSIPGMSSVVVLLALLYYVFSVMATQLYGQDFPEWFGTVGASAYSLFQIMTLESWSMGIVRPVMEVHANAWLFFIVFLMSTAFTVTNLFVGIIVDAMQASAQERAEDAQAHAESDAAAILAQLKVMQQQLAEMQRNTNQ